MSSQNRPTDIRDHVLAATLEGVRDRRERRRLGAAATALAAVGGIVMWLSIDATHEGGANSALVQDSKRPPIAAFIQRLPGGELHHIGRVSSDNALSGIQRIPSDPSIRDRVPLVTDDQLFASLPPGQAAGLVRDGEGGTRFIVFE